MQEDRQPLRTYEQSLWRLVQWSVSGLHAADKIDLAIQVVADVFWLSDAKVRHDVEKRVRALNAPARSRRHREVA